MRKPVKLRTLTAEEVTEVKRLANSRTAPIRLVQRAQEDRLHAGRPDDVCIRRRTESGLQQHDHRSNLGQAVQ